MVPAQKHLAPLGLVSGPRKENAEMPARTAIAIGPAGNMNEQEKERRKSKNQRKGGLSGVI